MADSAGDWPALPLAAWRETRDTLHMYTQIVGKIKLGLMPLERGWANVALFLTPRGFTTGAMPYGERMVQIDFDFVAHTIELTTSDGGARSIALLPARCVADIYVAIMAALGALGVTLTIWPMTVEVPNPTRCDEDRVHESYDPEYVERFRRAMACIGTAFIEHRAPFRGRHTPLQFFWGTFDLAYVRFSGRDADPPPNADRMMRIAMTGSPNRPSTRTRIRSRPDSKRRQFVQPPPAGTRAWASSCWATTTCETHPHRERRCSIFSPPPTTRPRRARTGTVRSREPRRRTDRRRSVAGRSANGRTQRRHTRPTDRRRAPRSPKVPNVTNAVELMRAVH